MDAIITVLPGDGIGPEVATAGRRVLETIAAQGGHRFTMNEALIGGAAIDASGDPLPPETVSHCRDSDAVLLGAVGGPKWSDPNAEVRPEQGLLRLRAELGVFANLRPVEIIPELKSASPLKPELLTNVDIMIIRELTGGIYFGAKSRDADSATDQCVYTVGEIERVVRIAADLARKRKGRLVSVDKANVLETSRLWRDVTTRLMTEEYADVELEHILVDAAAMHLISRPADFDVIVTENMFGDILTDEASMLAGSMGMLPSASVGDSGAGLYEPIHGSAPDIAGRGIANPCGTIKSVALMLRHSLNLADEADRIDAAVQSAVEKGLRTPDLAAGAADSVSTEAMTDAILAELSG